MLLRIILVKLHMAIIILMYLIKLQKNGFYLMIKMLRKKIIKIILFQTRLIFCFINYKTEITINQI